MERPPIDSRDIAERFAQSAAYEILEELGYTDQWTTPLADMCALAEIRADVITRPEMEHMLFEVLPRHHWRPAEQAHALAQEMRAFWMFSLFEADNPNAGDWADLVGVDLATNLEYVLRRSAPTAGRDRRGGGTVDPGETHAAIHTHDQTQPGDHARPTRPQSRG